MNSIVLLLTYANFKKSQKRNGKKETYSEVASLDIHTPLKLQNCYFLNWCRRNFCSELQAKVPGLPL
jgi:hypothetical protein